jgi:hypothetical protein
MKAIRQLSSIFCKAFLEKGTAATDLIEMPEVAARAQCDAFEIDVTDAFRADRL